MKFFSLNGKSPAVNFKEAMLKSLAPDGGLYFPEFFPKFSEEELENLKGKDLTEVATQTLLKWVGDDFSEGELRVMMEEALNFPLPLIKIGDYYVLELFHGPTLAFKDVAARVLARFMSRILEKEKKTATILVATSGDTGGAVAHGLGGVPNVKVVILYPKGMVSKLQEEQLTRVEPNVATIEVEGVFDDCQAFAKQAFNDPDLAALNLTAANSISVGRLLPQMVYYAYVYSQLYPLLTSPLERGRKRAGQKISPPLKGGDQEGVEFVVPCGNYGNLCAGVFAREMGFPFSRFLAVTNANDAAKKYYETGEFKPRATVATLSNAMDIGNPSNFIRIQKVFHDNPDEFRKVIKAERVDDKETAETIKKVYEKYNYLLDPHTAVAFAGAEKEGENGLTKVVFSTASPLKFADVIKENTGIYVDDSEEIKKLKQKEKRKISIKNNYEELKKALGNL
ncbi:MAG: threonine synthase [Patescibacteria group bacterium]|jgi:threonine synthase